MSVAYLAKCIVLLLYKQFRVYPGITLTKLVDLKQNSTRPNSKFKKASSTRSKNTRNFEYSAEFTRVSS